MAIAGQRRYRALSRRAPRQGYTLVFFALFFFAFMALAALVIDLGFARLTQRQLDNAARAGALEGLRGAGELDYVVRRENGRQVIRWYFDDDLDPSVDDGAFDSGSGQFGAGPLADFSGGAGDASLAASQLMTVDTDNPVYKPDPIDGSPSTDERFRVALRRGFQGTEPADLVAEGPAVPYFFARGSFVPRDKLVSGIALSGSATARPTPVLTIGLPQPENEVTWGLIPLVLDSTLWNSLWDFDSDPDSPPIALTVELPLVSGEVTENGNPVGITFALGSEETLPMMVGRVLPAVETIPPGTYLGYVPIYALIAGESETLARVVGFGAIEAVVDATGQTITLTPQRIIAPENASTSLGFTLPVSGLEFVEILTQGASIVEPLQAPGLWSDPS